MSIKVMSIGLFFSSIVIEGASTVALFLNTEESTKEKTKLLLFKPVLIFSTMKDIKKHSSD